MFPGVTGNLGVSSLDVSSPGRRALLTMFTEGRKSPYCTTPNAECSLEFGIPISANREIQPHGVEFDPRGYWVTLRFGRGKYDLTLSGNDENEQLLLDVREDVRHAYSALVSS